MDGVRIFVPHHKVWQFFKEHIQQCRESYILLAEDQNVGYGIYLTQECGLPVLYVFLGENDRPEFREELRDEASAGAIAAKAYRSFLSAGGFGDGKLYEEQDSEPDACLEVSEDDEIYAREDELLLAAGDFLSAVLRMYDGEAVKEEYGEELIAEFLEQALMTVAGDFGLPVYRPMHLEDGHGESLYVEYPYGEEVCP